MTRADYLALIDTYGGHFAINEFEIQSSIERLDTGFLQSFLAWRQWTGVPTMITSAWRSGDTGSHGNGKAIDCLLFSKWKSEQISALNHWLLATTWPFQGVGLYVDWSYRCPKTKAVIPAVGLHVDEWSDDTHHQRPLRWLRMDGLYYYQSVVDGTFYCRTNKQTITLYQVLKHHETRAKAINPAPAV